MIWLLGGIATLVLLISVFMNLRSSARTDELEASVAHLSQELKTRNTQLAQKNAQIQKYRAELDRLKAGGAVQVEDKRRRPQPKPRTQPDSPAPTAQARAELKPYECAIYNKIVRKMVAAGEKHKNLSDSWADVHYETVQAASEEDARQRLSKRYRESDGYVIDDVREL